MEPDRPRPRVTRITEPEGSQHLSPDPAADESESRDEHSPRRAPDEPLPYVAFGNAEARNGLQASVEIPLMLRLLRPPRGGRVLEVGCGRGVALPVLVDALAPRSIIGLDVDASLLAAARERLAAAAGGASTRSGSTTAPGRRPRRVPAPRR